MGGENFYPRFIVTKAWLKNALAFGIAQNYPVRVNPAPVYRGIETGWSIAPDSE